MSFVHEPDRVIDAAKKPILEEPPQYRVVCDKNCTNHVCVLSALDVFDIPSVVGMMFLFLDTKSAKLNCGLFTREVAETKIARAKAEMCVDSEARFVLEKA